MDAQQPSSIPEAQKTGVVSTPVTVDQVASATIGMPVADPSNWRKRSEVIKSIRNDGLVVVTGAGVSIQSIGNFTPSSEVAGWPGLLQHGVEHCLKRQLITSDEADIVKLQIKNGQKPGKADYLIEAAQRIHDCLGDTARSRYLWLEDSIGQLKVTDTRLIRAIQGLGSLITTLNYDDLVEQVTEWTTIELHRHTEVTRCIRERRKEVVIHLHGFWKNPESIVLDRISYEKIKSDCEARDRIRTFARDYTMLFIGCGNTFSDPNFQTLLSWAKDVLSEAKFQHYILCRQEDEPELLSTLPTDGFLTSLVYGNGYEELSPFLEALGDECGTSSNAINPPVAPTDTSVKPNRPADRWKLQSQR
jgi:hypothetical protein